MTFEELTKAGFTEDQSKKILEMHQKSIDGNYIPKATFEAERQKVKDANAIIAARDKQITELGSFKGTAEELQKKVDELTTANNTAKTEYEAKLTKMAQDGCDYAEVLKEAQEKGYAEADPTADVEGLDAARKATILASLAFNTRINLADVAVQGITKIESADIDYAKQLGYSVKLLAVARDYGDEKGVNVRVHPVFLPSTHPLSNVNDVFNAVFIRGNAVGELMFYGRGAGSLPTASAVVSDIVELSRSYLSGNKKMVGFTSEERRKFCPIEETLKGIGNGGGHAFMAGGFIPMENVPSIEDGKLEAFIETLFLEKMAVIK